MRIRRLITLAFAAALALSSGVCFADMAQVHAQGKDNSAYAELLARLKEQHGIFEYNSQDGMSHSGLCYANLVDFEGTYEPYLVVGYANEVDGSRIFGQIPFHYDIEVYADTGTEAALIHEAKDLRSFQILKLGDAEYLDEQWIIRDDLRFAYDMSFPQTERWPFYDYRTGTYDRTATDEAHDVREINQFDPGTVLLTEELYTAEGGTIICSDQLTVMMPKDGLKRETEGADGMDYEWEGISPTQVTVEGSLFEKVYSVPYDGWVEPAEGLAMELLTSCADGSVQMQNLNGSPFPRWQNPLYSFTGWIDDQDIFHVTPKDLYHTLNIIADESGTMFFNDRKGSDQDTLYHRLLEIAVPEAEEYGFLVSDTVLDMGRPDSVQRYLKIEITEESGLYIDYSQTMFGILVSISTDSISGIFIGPDDSGGSVSMDYSAESGKIRLVRADYYARYVVHYCFLIDENEEIERKHTAISRMVGTSTGDWAMYPYYFRYMDGILIAPGTIYDENGFMNDTIGTEDFYWDCVGVLIPGGEELARDNIQELAQGEMYDFEPEWSAVSNREAASG